MNLSKLFELQKQLDLQIEQQHPLKQGEDRLAKKILALQVELGELASEWRGFKYWSHNQEPRTKIVYTCSTCNGTGDENYDSYIDALEGGYTHKIINCKDCGGTGILGYRNPLLEEYIDCLHFILSIGLEIGVCPDELDAEPIFCADATEQFIDLFYDVSRLKYEKRNGQLYKDYYQYNIVLEQFLGLGKLFGFTWEQIEQAYLNKVESIPYCEENIRNAKRFKQEFNDMAGFDFFED